MMYFVARIAYSFLFIFQADSTLGTILLVSFMFGNYIMSYVRHKRRVIGEVDMRLRKNLDYLLDENLEMMSTIKL